MANWLGFDSNCYTGADCWNYDHSDRGLLIFATITGIALITFLAKKYLR